MYLEYAISVFESACVLIVAAFTGGENLYAYLPDGVSYEAFTRPRDKLYSRPSVDAQM